LKIKFPVVPKSLITPLWVALPENRVSEVGLPAEVIVIGAVLFSPLV